MHQEKYSLTWHTYSEHLKSMMKELMINEDFSDVTLVTEDKKQIKANVNILSACSPVFKDIFKKEKNSSTIMYLRGIQFSEIESIMQFIYLGEATFNEERMDEFLAVAKSLEIKNLCDAEPESNDEQDDPVTSIEKMEEEMVLPDHLAEQAPQERRRKVVSVNGKYECVPCQKTFKSRRGLDYHKQSVHQGVKYACDQCDYQATHPWNLTTHIQSKHEGIKYACDQCDYQASRQDHLTVHIQSKHKGVKFSCDQCDYQASRQGNLTVHIQSKHEDVKYACDQCNYQTAYQGELMRHIKKKHQK